MQHGTPRIQLWCKCILNAGRVELVELDGPFVTLGLHGRFWHKRGDVLARIAAYMQRRIPDVMEVNVESEDQLDDSAENF